MSKKTKKEATTELQAVNQELSGSASEPLQLDEARLAQSDLTKAVSALPEGETKNIALRVLDKINNMLDELTPAKLASMDGKSLSAAIGENINTLSKLTGKGQSDQSITVVIQDFASGQQTAVRVDLPSAV